MNLWCKDCSWLMNEKYHRIFYKWKNKTTLWNPPTKLKNTLICPYSLVTLSCLVNGFGELSEVMILGLMHLAYIVLNNYSSDLAVNLASNCWILKWLPIAEYENVYTIWVHYTRLHRVFKSNKMFLIFVCLIIR